MSRAGRSDPVRQRTGQGMYSCRGPSLVLCVHLSPPSEYCSSGADTRSRMMESTGRRPRTGSPLCETCDNGARYCRLGGEHARPHLPTVLQEECSVITKIKGRRLHLWLWSGRAKSNRKVISLASTRLAGGVIRQRSPSVGTRSRSAMSRMSGTVGCLAKVRPRLGNHRSPAEGLRTSAHTTFPFPDRK